MCIHLALLHLLNIHQHSQADLKAASAPSARAQRPWIIVWTHRPLYCSSAITWEDRCLHEAAEYRGNIEQMMADARVDLHISGHNHQ